MKLRIARFASWLLFAAPVFAQGSAKVPPEFEVLLPPDAAVFIQIRSLEELAAFVGRFQSAAEGKAPSAQEFIASMNLPGDVSLVDSKGTLGFALKLSSATPQPVPVFFVPTKDPKAYVNSLGLPEGTAQVAGSFVGISMGAPSPAQPNAPGGASKLLQGLPDGLVSVRVDLVAVLQVFRPMIDMMLAMAEQQMDMAMAQAGEEVPFDATEVMALYFDFARDFCDSAVVLDLGLRIEGAKAELAGRFETKEGSPLAGWAKEDEIDYRSLVGRLDPAAAMQFVAAFDFASWVETILPVYESMSEKAQESEELPPELADAFSAYLQSAREMLANLGDVSCGSFDLDAGGLRGAAFYESSDPAATAAALENFFRNPAFVPLGVRSSEPATREIQGARVTEWRIDFDPEMLMSLLGVAGGAELEPMRAMFDAIFGPDGLRFAIAQKAESLAVFFGGDEASIASGLARLTTPAPVPAPLAQAVEGLQGTNPGFVIHYDLGRLVKGFAGLLGPASDEKTLQLLSEAQWFSIDFWAGIDGPTWKGEVALDLDELSGFIQSMARIEAAASAGATADGQGN